MPKVTIDISMSLDGYVASPDASLEHPLGVGGEQLHEWAVGTEAFEVLHGRDGGVSNQDSEVLAEAFAAKGATVMGRRMFSGGAGPWEGDPNANGWWGDDPPFRHHVFVLTHHAREPVAHANGTTFVFVTDGIESAVEQARAAARGKDVAVAGGAEAAQQALRAGLVDEIDLHVAPVLLGGGARLFEDVAGVRLECTRVLQSPAVTHLRYRVTR